MRTLLFATTAVIPLHFAGFFLRDYHVAGFLISAFSLQVSISLITLPLSTIGGLSGLPLEMRIYPGKQFGQFAAAGSNVRSFTVFFASMIGGAFISLMTKRHGAHGWAYAYLWHGTFQTVGAACLWAVYFIWKRHGGESFKFDPENPDLPAGRPRARGFDVVLKQASIHS
jgi:hypothetical protein